jgi:hypothetical protein
MIFYKKIVYDVMLEAFASGIKDLDRHDVAILLAGPGATSFIDKLVKNVWNSGVSICSELAILGVPVVGVNIRFREEGKEEPRNLRDAYRLLPKAGLPIVTLIKIDDFQAPLWQSFVGAGFLRLQATYDTGVAKIANFQTRGWLPAGYTESLNRENFYSLVHKTQ